MIQPLVFRNTPAVSAFANATAPCVKACILACTAALALCGCGPSQPTPTPAALAPPVASASSGDAETTRSALGFSREESWRLILSDTGAAPTQVLRYALTEHIDSYLVSLSYETKYIVDGATRPTGTKRRFTLEVVAISTPAPSVTFHVSSVDGGTDSATIGVPFHMEADETGRVTQRLIAHHEPFDATATLIATSVEECFGELILPLPKEEVGRGASWSVQTPLEYEDFSGAATRRYRLLTASTRGTSISGLIESAAKRPVATRVADLREGEVRTDANLGSGKVDAWATPNSFISEGVVRQTSAINGFIREDTKLVNFDSRSELECVVERK